MKRNRTMLSSHKAALTASLICILVNLLLAGLKAISGILGDAPALLADAAHSASDLLSTVIVCIGIRIASAPADKAHPYGHERFESIASILLSWILFFAGVGIGLGGMQSICTSAYRESARPGEIALWVAGISVLAKVLLAAYMHIVAKKTSVYALRADAMHQLSDALASLGALLGVFLSRIGFQIFDPIASVFVSLFLFRTAIEVFRESAVSLVDCAADETVESELKTELSLLSESLFVSRTVSVSLLRTRRIGSKYYAEAELQTDAACPLSEIETTVNGIKSKLLEAHPEIKACSISVSVQRSESESFGEQS